MTHAFQLLYIRIRNCYTYDSLYELTLKQFWETKYFRSTIHICFEWLIDTNIFVNDQLDKYVRLIALFICNIEKLISLFPIDQFMSHNFHFLLHLQCRLFSATYDQFDSTVETEATCNIAFCIEIKESTC